MAVVWLNIMQGELFLKLLLSSDSSVTALYGDMALGQRSQVLAGKTVRYSRWGPVKHNLCISTSNCSVMVVLKYISKYKFSLFCFCSQGPLNKKIKYINVPRFLTYQKSCPQS